MNIGDELRKRLDAATGNSRNGWTLRKKIKLFPSTTEACCPYCGDWFPTNRIWLVNDNSNYLVGCWTKDGKSISADQIIHPHAWMSGEVCLGEQKFASEALFAGIAKGKHVQYVPRWLYQLGHKCDKIPVKTCPICASKFFEDQERFFGYRSHRVCSYDCLSVAMGFRCEECMGITDVSQKRLCADCDIKLTVECAICAHKLLSFETYFYSRKDLQCCHKCYTSELRSCVDCGYMEKISELDSMRRCGDCAAIPVIRCTDCDERVDSVNGQGICTNCANFCDECDCSPCECEPEPGPFYTEEEEFEEEEEEVEV